MSAELEDIHEECGIFGVWGHPDASRLTYFGLHALQHRGQEGAGIVSNDNGHLIGHRGLGLLTQVFGDEREIERLKGNCAIGHVRYATAGSGTTDNIQPFIFRFHDGDVALCHNGNLTNCPSLRRKLEDEGAIFHSNSDTEVLMHLIRRSMQRTFMDKLKEALNTVHGGFAYLLMTEDAMIGALDPNGFRPLSLGKMKNGAYVLASETCALDVVGAELVRNIRPGEIVVVNDHGYKIVQYTNNTQLAICSMEYIYFARPGFRYLWRQRALRPQAHGRASRRRIPGGGRYGYRRAELLIVRRIRLCGSSRPAQRNGSNQKPVCGPHLHSAHARTARAGCAYEAALLCAAWLKASALSSSMIPSCAAPRPSASCSCSRKPAPLKCICASAPRR